MTNNASAAVCSTSTVDYQEVKAWAFVQAHKLLKYVEKKGCDKGYVLFETGYGPSGLPHIGTFGEVARTLMVKQAFERISDIPTKLIAFSDDMDGLRKVPGNVPNKELLAEHLNKPLTEVPDPFGTHNSFGEHNNAMLCRFLDSFGFEYEFASSTEYYKSGKFDAALLKVLEKHEEIRQIVLPTLGEERQKTYSPFLPVCPETGHVLQVPVVATNVEKGTITYEREDGVQVETEVTGGKVKLQWKADWAMRWYALDVDYEMSGKDLIDSVTIGNRICGALGSRPPLGFTYEHFIDEEGRKISKSVGNGVSIDEWLQYANPESLALYMYRKPQTAKRLYLGMIPATVDEYFQLLRDYWNEDEQTRLENPVWHIHNGNPPKQDMPITYGMLLNMVSAAASDVDNQMVWGFINRYWPDLNAENSSVLDSMINGAINYYKDVVLPTKVYREPTEAEKTALADLAETIASFTGDEDPEDIQTEFYTVGKRHYAKEELKNWFGMLYEVLFGTAQGPRMGSFTKIYGVEGTVELIKSKL